MVVNAADTGFYGEWKLSYRNLSGFWNYWTFAPPGSAVTLGLNPDGTYYTKLNGGIVDQSTYQLTTTQYSAGVDTNYQFNNFVQTGLLSTQKGELYYTPDTLYLMNDLITPEGETFYVFHR